MGQKYKVFIKDKVTLVDPEKWSSFCAGYRIVEAAGGLVRNGRGELLFIFRNGMWDLPKGKMEKGERPMETALREVEEECGVSGLKIGRALSDTYHTYLEGKEPILKKTWWFEMSCEGSPALVPQQEEGITEVRWVDDNALDEVVQRSYQSIKEVIQSWKSSV